MANPIELIKNGILCANWQWVKEGYEILSDETIEIKEQPDKTSELIQQIEELINNYKKSVSTNLTPIVEPIINIFKRGGPEPKNFRPDPPQPLPMPLATGVSTINKKGYYGNEIKPITEDVPSEEINKNIEKSAITKERKTKRNPPKKYSIKCSQCEQNFESDRQESKDFGQKCPKCLQETINGKVTNE